MPEETLTCGACTKEFVVPYKERLRRRFCSRRCASSLRTVPGGPLNRQVKLSCPVCGNEFYRPPSQVRGASQCCSMRCMGALRRGKEPVNLREMTEAETAWLAGLFDGEGSIVLINRKRANGGSVRLVITNTYLPLLEQVFAVTGTGGISPKAAPRKPQHTQAHNWLVGGNDARELLVRMRPWLLVKAERADAVAEGRVFPRQARWEGVYPKG